MIKAPTIDPPSDDKRWRIVQATMRRNGFARHSLIETLHSVQEAFGYLDEDSLRYVAGSLRVPQSRVYGVSTFYHLFTMKPAGKHTCVICTGTACHIKGAPEIPERVQREIRYQPWRNNGRRPDFPADRPLCWLVWCGPGGRHGRPDYRPHHR
jgi:bidirectional [NiFe] hydrogenase diaphorase subunit